MFIKLGEEFRNCFRRFQLCFRGLEGSLSNLKG